MPYLEKVCKTNLSKLSLMMNEFGAFARQNNLQPSWTAYCQWGVKGKKIPLRFSKSRSPNIEEAYATHYVMNSKRYIESDCSNEETDQNLNTVLSNLS